MFTKLTTKIALRKAGIPSNALSFPDTTGGDSKDGSGGGSSPFAGAKDAWQNLQVPKALKSWTTPPPAAVEVAPAPVLGTRAPRDRSGKLELPPLDGRPSIVIFLRHTGCPFAEKTFIEARRLSNKFPRLSFILVSHASKAATDRWVSQVGGAWSMTVVVDPEREVYAAWGLGVSTTYHLLNPWTQMAMRRLGTEGGIWAREVDGSANRWLVGGAWGVDEVGTIRYGSASKTADDIPDLVEACKALGAY
ncbi:uncharacterized protein LY89DRAFT_701359 [Mollisia scopiformis]|uniref:Uncharacterized protein n=1 Tax=Mollisia scopiformis TaxID=149040 RepID=A0A132BA49_MOLSC|nr:uncharacterized protein LY89DRAFT_701359 [Mollisia scopiformis]KUJ09282.1 hypothetical protein LY89DRAFT_701359 [Mollisia scopiformis]